AVAERQTGHGLAAGPGRRPDAVSRQTVRAAVVDPTVVAQKLAFGLFVGSNYGVVAVGLTLIFGVMRVLNVAHGELLMLGGYASYVAFNALGVDPYLSVVLSAIALCVRGILLNTVLFQFVERP